MPFRDVHRVARTSLIAAAITLGPALDAGQAGLPSVQYRSPEGVEYRSLPDTDGVKSARAALEADPRNIARIIDLGVAQSGARQFREAIATFTRGLDIEPNNALLLRWRGHRYLSVREFDRAFADLTRRHDRQYDLRNLVPPRGRPVPARRFWRSGRILREGPADRAGRWRTGGVHGLVVDVAQPRRARRGREGDARPPA
ncbi:MAG TPA: tetratricopeptide repeat protein [Vicinamibacterales bacterium]|jgi:tetratricopeptide (TPR) repeat protein